MGVYDGIGVGAPTLYVGMDVGREDGELLGLLLGCGVGTLTDVNVSVVYVCALTVAVLI